MLLALVHHIYRGLELGIWSDPVTLIILTLDDRLKQVLLVYLCNNTSGNLTMGSDFGCLLLWLDLYYCSLAVSPSILDKQRLE